MNMLFSAGLLLLAVLWPLLLALLLAFRKMRPMVLCLAPWAALPALLASLLVTPSEMRWHLPGMMLGTELGLDTTGQMFLLLTTLLWTVSGIYAQAYFTKAEQRVRFYLFFLLAMGGNFALIVAQDLLVFYFAFTLMSFAAYGLVIFTGTVAALRAGRVYICLVVAGEIILFVALLLATQAAGSTAFTAVRIGLLDADSRDLVILLLLVGFGIKAGILGLHVWLPLAHPVASTPASAVLSGAMIKAGLLGWLRLLPLGEVALLEWGAGITALGLATAFYGVAIGLTQREAKILLAYSSISQMGIMTMAIGLGMIAPQAWSVILPGITFYAVHHGLSKGALFLGGGLVGSPHLWQRRCIWFGLCLPALVLAGAPWTSGMLAKGLIKSYLPYVPEPWRAVLLVLLSASAIATALLMMRLLYLLRPAAQPLGEEIVPGLVWPWMALIQAALLVPWWVGPSRQVGGMPLFDSLWPLVVAFLVGVCVLRMGLFRSVQPVPAGDVLWIFQRSLRPLSRIDCGWGSIHYIFSAAQRYCQVCLLRLAAFIMAKMKLFEGYFICWDVAVLLLVMMAVAVMGLMA